MRPPRRLTVVAPQPNPFGDQETDDFQVAWDRNFYMVLERRRDDERIVRMLYGGNRIDKAQKTFDAFVKKRPRARATIQQRARVIDKWPRED
jgi:hypothetical protein